MAIEANVLSIKFHADTLSEFLTDGMMLERRHYAHMKESVRRCPRVLNEPWFAEWMKIHRDNLVRTLGDNYGIQ